MDVNAYLDSLLNEESGAEEIEDSDDEEEQPVDPRVAQQQQAAELAASAIAGDVKLSEVKRARNTRQIGKAAQSTRRALEKQAAELESRLGEVEREHAVTTTIGNLRRAKVKSPSRWAAAAVRASGGRAPSPAEVVRFLEAYNVPRDLEGGQDASSS